MTHKKITGNLKGILYAHQKWIEGDPSSHCADLRGRDLAHLDFRGFNLSRANLSRANLEGANLTKVNLSDANLSRTNMHCATVKKANMTNACLRGAFGGFVYFDRVILVGSDMTGMDLAGANMSSAIMGDDANSQLNAARFRIVPEGDIIGWKKLREGYVAKMLIPKQAKRSNGFTRRCRAEYVKVLSIIDENDRPVARGVSRRDETLEYITGEIARPSGFDEDWKNECAQGINFFLTYEEANGY